MRRLVFGNTKGVQFSSFNAPLVHRLIVGQRLRSRELYAGMRMLECRLSVFICLIYGLVCHSVDVNVQINHQYCTSFIYCVFADREVNVYEEVSVDMSDGAETKHKRILLVSR